MPARKVTLLFLLLSFLISGCWDKQELEEQAYVVALGLDKGIDNMVKVTFQIANPQVGSTDKGNAPNEPPSDTITFTAADIVSAKELANGVITRKITFGHLRTLIVSEALAKTDLMVHILATALRDPEMRREINMIVSRETAVDFIHANKPKMETRPHKYYSFMQQRWRDTGHVPYATLNRYYQRVKGELFLAIYATADRYPVEPRLDEDNYKAGEIPQIGGDPVQLMGSAVIKDGKMIGSITGEETRFALLLRRKSLARSFIASYADPLDPKYRISVRIMKTADSQIAVDVKQDPPHIREEIPLNVQVLSVPSLIDYEHSEENQSKLKAFLEKKLTEDSMLLVKKSQKQFRSEPFLWYIHVRKKFRSFNQFESYDWESRFGEAKIFVTYKIKLQNFGKQSANYH